MLNQALLLRNTELRFSVNKYLIRISLFSHGNLSIISNLKFVEVQATYQYFQEPLKKFFLKKIIAISDCLLFSVIDMVFVEVCRLSIQVINFSYPKDLALKLGQSWFKNRDTRRLFRFINSKKKS